MKKSSLLQVALSVRRTTISDTTNRSSTTCQNFTRLLLVLFTLTILLTGVSRAATVNWIGAGSSAGGSGTVWNSGANWSGGSIPNASDDVVISLVSPATITLSSTPSENIKSFSFTSTTSSGILDMGSYTFSGTAGAFTLEGSAVLKVGAANSFPSGFSSYSFDTASTVEYYHNNTTTIYIPTAPGYGNLTIASLYVNLPNTTLNVAGNLLITSAADNGLQMGSAGTSTLNVGGNLTNNGKYLPNGSPTNVAGNFLNNGTIPAGAASTFSIGGNFSNTGTFPATNNSLVLNGTTTNSQSITNTTSLTCANVTVNTNGSVTLNNSILVTNTLTLTNGIVNAGNNTVTVDGGYQGTLSGGSSTSYINGKFARLILSYNNPIGLNSDIKFPVGKGGSYHPVILNFTALSANTVLATEQFETSLPFTTLPSGYDQPARYWRVTPGSAATYTYKIVLDGPGIASTGKILKEDGGATSTLTTVYSSNTFSASGLTSFSDFGISALPTCTSPSITASSLTSQSVCQDAPADNLSITPAGTATITYQWYANASNSNAGGTSVDGATSATFTPPTSSAGTTYYYCVATNGCGSVTSGTAEVIVKPAPILSTLTVLPTATCAGETVSVSATGLIQNAGAGTMSFSFTLTGSASGTYTHSSGTDASGVTTSAFVTPALSTGAYNLEVTSVTYGGCTTTLSGKSVGWTVNPKPTLATVTTTPVCEGTKATIHLTGLVPNTVGSATYTHPLLSGTQTASGSSDANGEFEFQTPELPMAANNTVATLTGITITASGCTQTFNSPVTLLVNPKPTLATITTTPVCEGTKATIHLTGLVPNTAGSATYTHPLLSGIQTASGSSDANGEFEFQTPELPLAANNTVATLTGITITASGCTQTFNSPVTLLVNPKPTLATVTTTPVCEGTKATIHLTGLVPNTAGSATYTHPLLSGPQTAIGSSDANGEFEFQTPELPLAANNTIATLTGIAITASGCTQTFNSPVTLMVNPKPTLATVTTTPVCEGTKATIHLTGLVPNTAGSATYTHPLLSGIQTASGSSDANGEFEFQTPELPLAANNTVATLTGIIITASGCTQAFNSPVTLMVNPKPTLATVTTTPVCEGTKATIHLTGLVPNTAGSATYTHPLLSGAQTATGSSDANGEFDFQTPELPLAANNTVATLTGITITASGCIQAFNSPVTLMVNPGVSAGTVTGSSTLCIGGTANFTSNGTSGGTWSSSDPTVATVSGVGVVTALTAGSTDIIYTVTSGCGSPQTNMQSLTVAAPAGLTSIPTTGSMTVASGSNDIIAGCAYIGKITNASFAGTNSPDMTLATSSGPYGSRKYTLTPSSGSVNTADIVMYFGQDDFDAFNIGSSVDLPTGPLDTQGMVNLRIKHTGLSTESIDPLPADIQWNSAKSWWEISFSVTHFSTFELEAVASPLPVTLTSFNAVSREQTALLNWATTFETNSQNFEVQHSQNGKVWKTLGSVASKGESRQLVSYQYLHTQPGNGENLYRLRMVDRDGTFAYSRITSLTFDLDDAAIIYPNPVADLVRINVRDWSNVKRVRIINLNGGTVYDSDIQNLSRTIDVKSVLPGLYVVEVVRNNGHTNATKVTISR